MDLYVIDLRLLFPGSVNLFRSEVPERKNMLRKTIRDIENAQLG